MPDKQKPSVGRVVHYWEDLGDPVAAIVTQVWDDECVNLTLFKPGITAYASSVVFSEDKKAGAWSWPARV